MFQMTLVPNRTTQKMFARLTSYRRSGKRVDRVLLSYNRFGKIDRTKAIRMAEESKDWTREPSGRSIRSYQIANREEAKVGRNREVMVDYWLGLPKGEEVT